MKPKTTPKDFFLWLGAIIALYTSATSLILLVHQYINAWLPDSAYVYGDPYSGPVRTAFAALIVMFPLFVWFMRMLHSDMRKDPTKKDIWVRRWLTVFTVFIAALTMAIDVIATINAYLQGDLTARFILKALVILVVLGAAFWYFLEELRGTWEKNAKLSVAVGWITSLVVLIALGSSFFIIGSPESARLMKFDNQRVSDLQTIQWQVINYWQTKQKLPGSIADMEDPLTGFTAPKDPQTGADYSYKPGEGMSFELCATFSAKSLGTSADAASRPTVATDPYGENWQHDAGETCFERVIDPQRFPPLNK